MSQIDTTDSTVLETVDEHSSEITAAARVVGISFIAVSAYKGLEVLTHKLLVRNARRRTEKVAEKDSTPPSSGKV